MKDRKHDHMEERRIKIVLVIIMILLPEDMMSEYYTQRILWRRMPSKRQMAAWLWVWVSAKTIITTPRNRARVFFVERTG